MGSVFGGGRSSVLARQRSRVHEGLTVRDLLDVFNESSGFDLLEHVAGGTCHHACVESIVVGEAGEHQTDELGVGRTQLPADLDPAAFLEADVQDRHVSSCQGYPGQGFRCGGGLTNDLYLLIALQEAPDALPYEFVVVEEKDADGHRSIVPAAHARMRPDLRRGRLPSVGMLAACPTPG